MAFRPNWYESESSGSFRNPMGGVRTWSAMKTIVVLTAGIWAIQILTGGYGGGRVGLDPLAEWFGLRSWWPEYGKALPTGVSPLEALDFNFFFPLQLLTYPLLHSTGSVWHIAMNMLYLWWFGAMLEASLGKASFLRLYAGAAVLGGLCQWAYGVFTKSPVPTVGASGAVYGVMVLFALRYPHHTLILFPIPIPIPAWFLVGFRVISDLLAFFGSGGGTTAVAAHLGGAAFGLLWFRRGDLLGKAVQTRRLARSRQHLEDESEGRQEMDRILAKIQATGLASLDPKERAFLDRRSRHLREEQ